ncbi:hypothetical protein D9M69_577360 [compost metagenome]
MAPLWPSDQHPASLVNLCSGCDILIHLKFHGRGFNRQHTLATGGDEKRVEETGSNWPVLRFHPARYRDALEDHLVR